MPWMKQLDNRFGTHPPERLIGAERLVAQNLQKRQQVPDLAGNAARGRGAGGDPAPLGAQVDGARHLVGRCQRAQRVALVQHQAQPVHLSHAQTLYHLV